MALQGTAFLALWNDFDPARDVEYNCWHTFEHVPERVGIDGVLSGRRYWAKERDDWRYFTLYELTDLAALEGDSYMDVVNHPTEWSLSMRTSFRNFFRQPCTTEFSVGQGHGASLATCRFSLAAAASAVQWRALLAPLVESGSAVAIHLGRVDTSAKFPVQNAGPKAAPGIPYVLVIEGVDRVQVETAVKNALAAIEQALRPTAPVEGHVYDFASVVEKKDLADQRTKRQPQRPDLKARWPRAG